MTKKICISGGVLAVWLLVGLLPVFALASEITIRPFLIDETLMPREQVQNVVTLKSSYDYRKAVLYATVNEITIDAAGEVKEFISPVMTDRTNTVTSWIEVNRGRIEIPFGEAVEVPITIRLHPNAEPGEYHAFIGFVEASNRDIAEQIALEGKAQGVVIKVTVPDQRDDTMRISSFSIERFITGEDGRTIAIEVENTGDISSAPMGEIIFYDSRGIEVTSVPINQEAKAVAPGETVTLVGEVPFNNDLGRYKANLSLRYGLDQRASLYDTTFFYFMPWHLLLLIFAGILLVTIVLALLFRRAFTVHHDDDDCQEVTLYVRDGHEPNPKDHDIDLTKDRS